jgi:hypothetical protein
MHVFVHICMYAISTENMPSIIVYMTWALGVYVFECMCMYLYVSCMYLHVYARICTYLHVCHIHRKNAKYNCIHDLGVQIRTYTYVYMLILAYTYRYMHIRTLYVTPKSVVCNAQVRNFSHIHVRKPQVSRM